MTSKRFLAIPASIFVLTLWFMPNALAQCGLPAKLVHPASWHPQDGNMHLMRAALSGAQFHADEQNGAAIVGMWHVTFTAKTMNGASIPETVIDNALVVWHSDKTEIMNSGRPPQDGDFCMGVWEHTRNSNKYKLNHFAWGGNAFPTDPPTEIEPPAGPTHTIEEVTLSPDGDHYTGPFTLDARYLGKHIHQLQRCDHGDTHHHGHEGRRSALREAGSALVRAAGVRPAALSPYSRDQPGRAS